MSLTWQLESSFGFLFFHLLSLNKHNICHDVITSHQCPALPPQKIITQNCYYLLSFFMGLKDI